MPTGRLEWGIFWLGLAALAALGAVIALSLADGGQASGAALTSVRTATVALPAQVRDDRHVPAATADTSGLRLRLRATRGDSWLEVRDGSPRGDVLFLGTLHKGRARVFRADSRLWIRFGGASNLDATLDGRALPLQFGTYDALVTPAGVTLLGG